MDRKTVIQPKHGIQDWQKNPLLLWKNPNTYSKKNCKKRENKPYRWTSSLSLENPKSSQHLESLMIKAWKNLDTWVWNENEERLLLWRWKKSRWLFANQAKNKGEDFFDDGLTLIASKTSRPQTYKTRERQFELDSRTKSSREQEFKEKSESLYDKG